MIARDIAMVYNRLCAICGKNKKSQRIEAPFHHRENLLNFFILSDLLIFIATICWMEFSQSVFVEYDEGNSYSVLYQISPLSLFIHNCESYATYIWILLFNISTFVALSIVVLCIWSIHQTSFEPSCIVFLILTLIAFITVSTFPIIAFISFFKLSIFVLSSLMQSNINIIPAIYSQSVLFPIHDNLNNPDSDEFYQKLYSFIYKNKTRKSFNWEMFVTLAIVCFVPVFAFLDCDTVIINDENKSEQENKNEQEKRRRSDIYDDISNINDMGYELRLAIANKVLANHYSNLFWIPYNSKYVSQQLMKTPYYRCTERFIRKLRGYSLKNIIKTIQHSLLSEIKNCDDYDKMLEIQYALIIFLFIPLQTIFAFYGLCYPYIILLQIINDLYNYHILQQTTFVFQNEIIKILLESNDSLFVLSTHIYFVIFIICLITNFIILVLIINKVWNLRFVFEMCLNALIIQDNCVLNQELINEMRNLEININATRIRNQRLSYLFGRYHLHKLIIEYLGEMHYCGVYSE